MKVLISILFPFFIFSQVNQTTWEKIKARDDIWHIDGSTLITVTATEIVFNQTHNKKKSILTGAAISLGIGVIGKEIIYDKILGRGVFSIKDIFYDVWGTLVGVIIEICWLDYRYGYQEMIDIEYPVKKHRKKWSFKLCRLLK